MALAFLGFLGDLKAAEESVAIARTLDNKSDPCVFTGLAEPCAPARRANLPLARTAAAESTRLARARSGVIGRLPGRYSARVNSQSPRKTSEQARSYLQESMVLFTQSQDSYHANVVRTELANVERWKGNNQEALKLYLAAIRVWQDLGLQAAIAQGLEYIGLVAAAEQSFEHAVRLWGAARICVTKPVLNHCRRNRLNSRSVSHSRTEFYKIASTIPYWQRAR